VGSDIGREYTRNINGDIEPGNADTAPRRYLRKIKYVSKFALLPSRLLSQSRLLPASVVNEELETRIEEFRQRMQDPAESRSILRWTDFDLSDQTIRNHVANGMHLTHLAIEYDNVMSCVLITRSLRRLLGDLKKLLGGFA